MPLDPVFGERLHLLRGIRTWDAGGDDEVAARLAEWNEDPAPYTPAPMATREVQLDADSHPFRVRVYGSGEGSNPCLVWVHGGAFFAGDLDMREADTVAREIASRAHAVVVSVDYSLVPHVAYPVPHHQVAPSTAYKLIDNQVIVPSKTAAKRGGIQPVVELTVRAPGHGPATTGRSVKFRAVVHVPPGQGKIISADWDFEGSGHFTKVSLTKARRSLVLTGSFTYEAAGTYYPALRVTTNREGDLNARFALVQNLDRVRVVVTQRPWR